MSLQSFLGIGGCHLMLKSSNKIVWLYADKLSLPSSSSVKKWIER